MQISLPPLILPPITQSPSKSHQVNILLDQTHYHIQKLELVLARQRLFEAYSQYQMNDALFDEIKSYFFLLNGYILMLMVECQQFDEITKCQDKNLIKMEIPTKNTTLYLTQHYMKAAAQSFLNSIELVEIKDTVEKATPRIYLAALYYFTRQYAKATYFLKQAEALAVSAEGKDSVLYNISCYNLIILALNQFFLYCNQMQTPTNPIISEKADKSLYQQKNTEETYFKPQSNPRFDNTGYNPKLSDNNYQFKEFEYHEVDYSTQLYNLGANLTITQSNQIVQENNEKFRAQFKYEPMTSLVFNKENLFPMLKRTVMLKESFYKIFGNNIYYQNCVKLEKAIQNAQYEVETILDKQSTFDQTLQNCPIFNKHLQPVEDVALINYAKRFSQIQNTNKKAKKAKAPPKKAK